MIEHEMSYWMTHFQEVKKKNADPYLLNTLIHIIARLMHYIKPADGIIDFFIDTMVFIVDSILLFIVAKNIGQ